MKISTLFICIVLTTPCLARTITVDANGTGDYPTIQAAIDDANDGDEIVLLPGIYTGDDNHDINYKGKAILIRSIDPNDSNTVAVTVIDCKREHRGFRFYNGEGPTSVLSGVTIKNGYYEGAEAYGGGILCQGASPTVSNCIITNCRVYTGSYTGKSRGGGMYNHESNPLINSCTFRENQADHYVVPGYGSGGGVYNYKSNPIINNCTFTDNRADYGGGMTSSDSDAEITSCTFIGNIARKNGGGMFNYGPGSEVTSCNFIRNSAYYYGGGGVYNYESEPRFTNCTFNGNKADDYTTSSEAKGGGMYNISSHPIVNNCTFVGNWANYGGAVHNGAGNPTLSNCIFTRNTAEPHGGGGMSDWAANTTVTNCTFCGNLTTSLWRGGGGIFCWEGDLTLANCTFSGNSANCGGGIYCWDQNSMTLGDCILWANTAPDGNEIALLESSVIDVNYCDIKGGQPGIYRDGTSTINWGVGNIDVDPCFVDSGYWDPNGTPEDANDDFWVDGDYHLKSEGWRWDSIRQRWDWDDVTSRCIDAGNPGSVLGDEPLTIPDDPNNIWGHNLRINMGVYGGTVEASMPPYDWALLSDVTNDGTADLSDFAHLADMFMQTDDELFADFNRDGKVDLRDLALFIADWLHITTWH